MKLSKRSLFSALLVMASTVTALPGQNEPTILPFPLPNPRMYQEIRQFLSLTDPQLERLQAIQRERQEAESRAWRQVAEKRQELERLLQSGSRDANRIGQLTIEIHQLERQQPQNAGPYRTQALAVLNEVQRRRLTELEAALRLQQPGWQAVSLNLLDGPGSAMLAAPGGFGPVQLPGVTNTRPE